MLLILTTCKKKEFFSEIPAIEYKGHYFLLNALGKDSLVVLIFSFKDGDGNIGLNEADTMPPFNPVIDNIGNSINPYYYNMYIDYLEFLDGEFKYVTNPFSNDTLNFEYRIPSLTPDGRHLAIRGDIEVKVEASPYPNAKDTVMYKFYIYDRALNKSNIIQSTPIAWLNR